MMTLQQAAQWIGEGRLVEGGQPAGALQIARVHTDTRTLQPGDLFVALKGEKFNANEFLPQARTQGAVAAIAERGLAAAGLPGVEVADTRHALGRLAAGWRAQFHLPMVAVTGSNGKTTVTQMVAAVLRAFQGDAAFFTQGNLNNDVGVPMTLLRLRQQHAVGVVELGMNHPGEIAWLASITAPTVALVNNAQREHQEFMASVEAVARENGAAIGALPENGVAVFPAGDPYTPLWAALAGTRAVMTFTDGDGAAADVALLSAQWQHGAWRVRARTPAGTLEYTLRIAGRHNVRNSLAATACALAVGVPPAAITAGLQAFEPVKGRSRAWSVSLGTRELTLVDDTYNANPDSVRAAIDVLAELPGPRLLVLGDMGEVGSQGPQFHTEVGAHAASSGIERLFTFGELSRHAATAFGGARHFGFDDIDALRAAVLEELPHTASLLVKGSRFTRTERVVESVAAFASQIAPTHSAEQAHAA